MKLFTSLLAVAILFVGAQAATAQTKAAPKPAAKPAAAAVKTPAKPAAPATAKPAPAKPAAPAAAAATPAPEPAVLVSDKLAPAAPSSNVLKVRVENNPITKRLVVRTNSTGPTRVEVNDDAGRPVLTKDIMTADDAAVLDVSGLPAGSYVVQCTSGERRGMRRVVIGQ